MSTDLKKANANAAAKFALENLGSPSQQDLAARFAFGWLAGMNYLQTSETTKPDLQQADPREVLDAFVVEEFRFGEREWSAGAMWQSLKISETIYSEREYLEWLGIDDPSMPIDRLPQVLDRLSRMYVFGGYFAPNIDECVALLGGAELCSGVLIHPKVVLGVKHCSASKRVAFGPWAYDGQEVPIECHSPYGPLDVALYRLKSEAPVEPAKLANSEMIKDADKILIAGFGLTDLFVAGEPGQRRKACMRVIAKTCNQAAKNKYECKPGEMVLGGTSGPCPSDSGGPGFVVVGSKRCLASTIVGPTPKGHRSGCGDASIHVRLDLLRGWINGVLDSWGFSPIQQCS